MVDNQQMTYMAKIGVDGSEFTSGLGKMANDFTAFFGPTGMAVGAVAVTAGAISSLIQEQGKLADSNLDLAETTGIAVEEIQRFHYAAKLSGDSISTVDTMLNKLTLSMGEARNATSAQAAAFSEMGIDPTGKTTSEVFEEMARALSTMNDRQRAASLAMDILGKSYKETLPYMADYIKNIEEINSKEMFTQAEEEQLQRGKEAFDKLGASAEGASGRIAIALVEIMESVAKVPDRLGGINLHTFFGGEMYKGVTSANDDFGSGALGGMQSPDAIKMGIVDPYKDWTAAEVEVWQQADKVTEAQNKLAEAMKQANTPENVKQVKLLSAAYIEQEAILQGLTSTAKQAQQALNPYYDPGAVENQAPSTAEERAAAMFGVNYGSGANVGYYEGEYAANTSRYQANLAFAMSDTTGNASLAAIKSLDASRYRLNNVDNPNYGAGTGTYASMSDQYMAAYKESMNPTVVIQVSPDFSESAQSIAEKTAEALSRALARQASGT